MANVCGNSIHLCFVRATRLNNDGTVASAPNNHAVTSNPVILTAAPEILAGEVKNLIGGCDCVNAQYRGYDKLLFWNLTLQFCALEPALLEILTGGSLQVNGTAEPIGLSWPNQTLCSAPHQPAVAIEAWSDLWVGSAQNTNPRYIRWVWPMAFFHMDQFQVENDFLLPQVVGFSRANANFGNAYADLPTGVVANAQGGFFYDNVEPTAVCGYSSSST